MENPQPCGWKGAAMPPPAPLLPLLPLPLALLDVVPLLVSLLLQEAALTPPPIVSAPSAAKIEVERRARGDVRLAR